MQINQRVAAAWNHSCGSDNEYEIMPFVESEFQMIVYKVFLWRLHYRTGRWISATRFGITVYIFIFFLNKKSTMKVNGHIKSFLIFCLLIFSNLNHSHVLWSIWCSFWRMIWSFLKCITQRAEWDFWNSSLVSTQTDSSLHEGAHCR